MSDRSVRKVDVETDLISFVDWLVEHIKQCYSSVFKYRSPYPLDPRELNQEIDPWEFASKYSLEFTRHSLLSNRQLAEPKVVSFDITHQEQLGIQVEISTPQLDDPYLENLIAEIVEHFGPKVERRNDLGEEYSGNRGIPVELRNQLRETLLECDLFATDHELNAIFISTRLAPWHNRLPQANNPTARVEGIIEFLYKEYHDTEGENALILMLYELQERLNYEDALFSRLGALTNELKRFLEKGNALEHKI